MEVIRRVVVFAGILAFAWGAAQFVLPINVTAGSALPGPLEQLAPDSISNRKLDCGSVVAPAPFDSIDDLLKFDCDRALGSAQGRGLLWMGVGAGGALLAVVLLRDPGDRRRAQPTRPVDIGDAASSSDSLTTDTTPLPPSLDAPPGVQNAPELQRVDESRPPWYRRPSTIVVGVVMALVGIIVVASTATDGDTGGSGGPVTQPVATVDRAAMDCMTVALSDSDVLHEQAEAASRRDQEQSIVNLDGDASFLDYAAALERLDLADCPAPFRTAFATWVETWQLYGQDLKDGGADIGEYISLIQLADDGLRASASEAGLEVQSRTWRITTSPD